MQFLTSVVRKTMTDKRHNHLFVVFVLPKTFHLTLLEKNYVYSIRLHLLRGRLDAILNNTCISMVVSKFIEWRSRSFNEECTRVLQNFAREGTSSVTQSPASLLRRCSFGNLSRQQKWRRGGGGRLRDEPKERLRRKLVARRI